MEILRLARFSTTRKVLTMSEDNAQGAPEATEDTPANDGQDSEVAKELAKVKAEAAQRRIENRDLSQKLEQFEKQRQKEEEERQAEQGKFKELYEAEKAKAAEFEKLQEQLQTYQKRDEDRFNALLEKVPDNFKDLLTDDLPLAKRLQMAEKFAQEQPKPPGYRPPGDSAAQSLEQKIKSAKTSQELEKILAENTS